MFRCVALPARQEEEKACPTYIQDADSPEDPAPQPYCTRTPQILSPRVPTTTMFP